LPRSKTQTSVVGFRCGGRRFLIGARRGLAPPSLIEPPTNYQPGSSWTVVPVPPARALAAIFMLAGVALGDMPSTVPLPGFSRVWQTLPHSPLNGNGARRGLEDVKKSPNRDHRVGTGTTVPNRDNHKQPTRSSWTVVPVSFPARQRCLT